MSLYAVTVLGEDRPGIVADLTAALADLGGNLEDSTMTLLRGHFAMVVLVEVADDRAVDEQALLAALAGLSADGRLVVEVRPVPGGAAHGRPGTPYVLSVHGGDRPGIVSAVTRVVADAGGNITDLTTRLSGDLYVLIAEVDLPRDADADALAGRLAGTAAELGVDASLRPADPDEL